MLSGKKRNVFGAVLVACLFCTIPMALLCGAAHSPGQDEDRSGEPARSAFFEGLSALRAGQPEMAKTLFADVIKLAPDWALAHLHLGIAEQLLAPGSEAAVRALERAVDLAPHNPRAHYQLGQAYERAERPHDAVRSLNTALQLRPSLIDGWFRLGVVLRTTGDIAGALRAHEQVLSRDGRHLGALAAVADLYETRGDVIAAEQALVTIARSNPTVAYHHYRLAQFYERNGQASKARAAFRRANAIDPLPKRRMRRLR